MKSPTGIAKQNIDKMKELFFYNVESAYFDRLDSIIKEGNILEEEATTFKQNIVSICYSASIPYTLASNTAFSRARDKVGVRESILGANLSHEEIMIIVNRKFIESLDNQETSNEILNDLALQLIGLAIKDELSVKELLNQNYIQLWSAFEVFIRDYIEKILNEFPDSCKSIIESDILKRRVDLRKIPFDYISENSFNLSNKMGTLITSSYDCSDLLITKEIIKSIKKSEEINSILDHKNLWNFFQNRHLLIHKKGIVDKGFIEKTGSTKNIGEKVSITPKELKNTMDLVLNTVIKIIQ
jgi:hypothetical protein